MLVKLCLLVLRSVAAHRCIRLDAVTGSRVPAFVILLFTFQVSNRMKNSSDFRSKEEVITAPMSSVGYMPWSRSAWESNVFHTKKHGESGCNLWLGPRKVVKVGKIDVFCVLLSHPGRWNKFTVKRLPGVTELILQAIMNKSLIGQSLCSSKQVFLFKMM